MTEEFSQELPEATPEEASEETPEAAPEQLPEKVPAKLTFRSCMGSSWTVVKNHWVPLITAAFLRDFIAMVSFGAAFAAVVDIKDWCLWIGLAAGLIVRAAMQCGYLKFCQHLRDHNQVDWKLLFSGFDLTMDMLMASICFNCAVALGLVALVVPGILLSVRWSLFGMALVDQKLDSEKSLAASHHMLKGFGWVATGLLVTAFVGENLLHWWSYGFEALYSISLWTLYNHIRSQEVKA